MSFGSPETRVRRSGRCFAREALREVEGLGVLGASLVDARFVVQDGRVGERLVGAMVEVEGLVVVEGVHRVVALLS